MVYKIIFEERKIFNDDYDELDLAEVVGFLDIHSDEDGDTELNIELNEIISNAFVVDKFAEGYVLVTDVPKHFIDNSEPNGNFNEVEEFNEEDYDKAIDFIKNLKKITFEEIELWYENE